MSLQKNPFPREKNFAKFFSLGKKTLWGLIFCYFHFSEMAKKLGVATEKKEVFFVGWRCFLTAVSTIYVSHLDSALLVKIPRPRGGGKRQP